MGNTFGLWDSEIHASDDQMKRITSASSSNTTPESIDKTNQTGVFPGSGKKPYTTSLNSCTCTDFSRRKLPCKHMYRLAMECGLFPGEFKSGLNKNIYNKTQRSIDDAVAELENLNDDAQQSIYSFLYANLFHDAIYLQVSNEGQDASLLHSALFSKRIATASEILSTYKKDGLLQILKDAGLACNAKMKKSELLVSAQENEELLRDSLPRVYVLSWSADFESVRRGLYSYLLRKYDWDYIMDIDFKTYRIPHGAKCVDDSNSYIFPDDHITSLLNRYGHNRCINGFAPELCDS